MTDETRVSPRYGYLVTQAAVFADDNSGVVDLDASVDALNELSKKGWELVAVDQGIAYWRLDVQEYLETVKEDRSCGTCVHMDGNLCQKFGHSVAFGSPPETDNCYQGKLTNARRENADN